MHKPNFIIGLPSEIPSTRILKPPGGECSDLFGLKSRQKAVKEFLSRKQSKINYDDFPLQRIHRSTPIENFKILQTENLKRYEDLMVSDHSVPDIYANQTNDIKPDKEVMGKSNVRFEECNKRSLEKVTEELKSMSIKEDTRKVSNVRNSPQKPENSIARPTKSSIQKRRSGGVTPNINSFVTSVNQRKYNARDPKTNLQKVLTTKPPSNHSLQPVRNPITGTLSDIGPVCKTDLNIQTLGPNNTKREDLSSNKSISHLNERRNPITGVNTIESFPKQKRTYRHAISNVIF